MAKSKKTEGMVKVELITDYCDVGKAGEVVEFDITKAEELIRLGRAKAVK